jgi:plasmid stabilization system protein ParE
MKIIYSFYAKQELLDAVYFYNLEYQGLGDKFKQEIYIASLRIANFPSAWSVERDDIRKCILHKFPYKILYSIEKDHIFIIAIAHQHRKPDYWVR